MSIIYRQGTLSECVQVVEQIDEFRRKETIETLSIRLQQKRHLIQAAEQSVSSNVETAAAQRLFD